MYISRKFRFDHLFFENHDKINIKIFKDLRESKYELNFCISADSNRNAGFLIVPEISGNRFRSSNSTTN
jgi:hypothetical protein